MTSLTEMVQRNQSLWEGVCWTVTVLLAGLGLPFLIIGVDASPNPAIYESITRYVPGGIRTYGAVMLLFALTFAWGLLRPLLGRSLDVCLLVHALASFAGFCVGMIVALGSSWIMNGTPTFLAMIYWAPLGGLAALASRLAPERDGCGRAS